MDWLAHIRKPQNCVARNGGQLTRLSVSVLYCTVHADRQTDSTTRLLPVKPFIPNIRKGHHTEHKADVTVRINCITRCEVFALFRIIKTHKHFFLSSRVRSLYVSYDFVVISFHSLLAVSYTHLDVYKRQVTNTLNLLQRHKTSKHISYISSNE